MTSRSRKNRQTIALMFQGAKRSSLAILIAGYWTLAAWSQSSTLTRTANSNSDGSLRPVTRIGFEQPAATAAQPKHDPQRDGWNLRWRRSPNLPQDTSEQDPFAEEPSTQEPSTQEPSTEINSVQVTSHQSVDDLVIAGRSEPPLFSRPSRKQINVVSQPKTGTTTATVIASGGLQQAATHVQAEPTQVTRTTWLVQPQQTDGFELPASPPRTNGVDNEAASEKSENDFFINPFGGDSNRGQQSNQDASAEQAPSIVDPTRPVEPRSMNQLRSEASDDGSSALPLPPPRQPAEVIPTPNGGGASLGDMLREQSPRDRNETLDQLPGSNGQSVDSPSDRPGQFANPFPRDQADDDNARSVPSERERESRRYGAGRLGDEDPRQTGGISCEEFRHRIAVQTIDRLSLDISPPFRPDVISEVEYEQLKEKFNENQSQRQWRSIDGRPLATGKLVDLAYEKAVIETSFGTTEELSINRLSEPDLAYISENWGLPKECLIEQVAYTPRAWQSTTMTWKASNLCHKPLYFEDVNLERYGHTRGPLWQPVVSSAHFFANIAVLPYKMGVHSPSECQYALGYYRPGNCAPWIQPPVPISVRGGLAQAAAVTGLFWLIP